MYRMPSAQAKGTRIENSLLAKLLIVSSAIVPFPALIVLPEISNQYAITKMKLLGNNSCWKRAQIHRQMMEGLGPLES